MSKEGQRHIKNCLKLYGGLNAPSVNGPSAVYSYANKEGITDWRHCKGCEADTPTADDTCLVCFGNQEGRLHVTEAREVETEGDEKFEVKFQIKGKTYVLSAHQRTDPNFPGIDINVNGDTAVVVEYTSTDEEIKIRTYTKESDEPVTNLTYEKVN